MKHYPKRHKIIGHTIVICLLISACILLFVFVRVEGLFCILQAVAIEVDLV